MTNRPAEFKTSDITLVATIMTAIVAIEFGNCGAWLYRRGKGGRL